MNTVANESLSVLRSKAQELSSLKDAASLLRIKYPDDQGYMEALNASTRDLAEVEAAITLYEASHRGEILAKAQEDIEARKLLTSKGRQQATTAMREKVKLAQVIDSQVALLGKSLKQWDQLSTQALAGTALIALNAIEDHTKRYEESLIMRGYAGSLPAQSLTQALLNINIDHFTSDTASFDSHLVLTAPSMHDATRQNEQLLLSKINEVTNA